MIYSKNNKFVESGSPHSLGLQNALTVPNPGFDTNNLMVNEKRFWGAGLQGLTMDGTGLFGTGLFSGGLDLTTYGPGEWACVVLGGYMLYSMFHTTSHAVSYAKSIPQERRRKRASKLRKKADEIESKGSRGGRSYSAKSRAWSEA
jgi:hypothetical protein